MSARYVNARKGRNGWIISSGYRYTYGSRWVIQIACFDKICGTSAIVRNELVSFGGASLRDVEQGMCAQLGHLRVERCFRTRGTPLDELPFPGAIYVRGHSGNLSQTAANPGRRRYRLWRQLPLPEMLTCVLRTRIRPLTKSLREQFLMSEIEPAGRETAMGSGL